MNRTVWDQPSLTGSAVCGSTTCPPAWLIFAAAFSEHWATIILRGRVIGRIVPSRGIGWLVGVLSSGVSWPWVVLFLLVAYDKQGLGLSRGWVGLELNIFRIFDEVSALGKAN